jgi:hypothetical protein
VVRETARLISLAGSCRSYPAGLSTPGARLAWSSGCCPLDAVGVKNPRLQRLGSELQRLIPPENSPLIQIAFGRPFTSTIPKSPHARLDPRGVREIMASGTANAGSGPVRLFYVGHNARRRMPNFGIILLAFMPRASHFTFCLGVWSLTDLASLRSEHYLFLGLWVVSLTVPVLGPLETSDPKNRTLSRTTRGS